MVTVVHWTGIEVYALRNALRMGLRTFAAHTGLSVSRLAEMETEGPGARLRHGTQQVLDQLLDGASPGARVRFEVLLAERRAAATAARHGAGTGEVVTAVLPQTRCDPLLPFDPDSLRGESAGSPITLVAGAGRVFTGSSIGARLYPAVHDGPILTTDLGGEPDGWTAGWSGRVLIVGLTERDGAVDAFGMDSRRAREHLVAPDRRLRIPRAYLLDDLTVGLLWAVANLDSALLGDDARLAACRQWVSGYELLACSSASRDAVAGLSPVSQMWLGSDFCARHILRHCGTLAGMPAFWTREQQGEQASTWLLFTHKHEYLRQLADRHHSPKFPLARTFSVTEEAIVGASRPERVLLMLAVALMESFGIRVNVCTDAAYRVLEGFVLDRQRSAIVANWVDTEAVWNVDVNTDQPALRGYADALDHGQAHSAIAAATPRGRLMSLAGLLDLDWPWLARRCGELAAYGSAGVSEPRSRLLSTAGVDRACGYLATVAGHSS